MLPVFLSALRLNRPRHDLGDIFDLHFIFGFDTLDAVVEHGDAEGTGGSKNFRARIKRLVHARLVDTFARLLLHPGATATAAAAEALIAVAAHLRHTVAVENGQHAARLIVDVVVTPNVAGVVIGQLALVKALRQRDLLVRQQAINEDRVMHYFVIAAKLRVLVLDGIEAVRAGRNDGAVLQGRASHAVAARVTVHGMRILLLAHIEAVAFERFDVLLRHHCHRYSLPIRRAGSPVQDSSGPRMAKLTPAACKILTTAVATFWLRWSKEPMQPTQ